MWRNGNKWRRRNKRESVAAQWLASMANNQRNLAASCGVIINSNGSSVISASGGVSG